MKETPCQQETVVVVCDILGNGGMPSSDDWRAWIEDFNDRDRLCFIGIVRWKNKRPGSNQDLPDSLAISNAPMYVNCASRVILCDPALKPSIVLLQGAFTDEVDTEVYDISTVELFGGFGNGAIIPRVYEGAKLEHAQGFCPGISLDPSLDILRGATHRLVENVLSDAPFQF